MAENTVQLGFLIDRTDFELFDFEYQVDDPQFKADLEQSIIDYYYDYEIGQETPDMFKRKFKARYLRAVSYYNKLYNTTLLEYNPLINSKMSEALEQLATTSNTQDSTVNTTGTGTTEVTGSDSHDSTITADNTRTDNTTSATVASTDDSTTSTTNSTRTDNTTSATDSTRTDNTTQTNDTNEKTSDYPQQAIAGGDFLNGERDATSTTQNTGTVNTDTTTSNTGTVDNDSTTTSSGSADSDSTTTNTGTVTNSGTTTTAATGSNNSTTTSGDTQDSTSQVIASGTNDMTYSKTIEGLTGTTYQELIQKERANILRINNMVIAELKPCFMLIH